MTIVFCSICSTKFYTKPFLIKKGYGKYCSRVCQHLGRRNGKFIQCAICNKKVYKSQRALKGSKSKKYFCGRSCQTKWRNSKFVGPKHFNWKYGEHSYRGVMKRNKVFPVCNLCKTKDFRILAVHHVDKNKRNNKVDNLAWLCHNCHHLVHYHKDEEKRLMEALV